MTLQEALAAVIAAALAEGVPQDQVFANLIAAWSTTPPVDVKPPMDEYGRLKIAGRFMYAPFPISEGWELTETQRVNIRMNCGVDALGRWKYVKDGKVVYVPSAFSGFSLDSPISYLDATHYKTATADDGTVKWVPAGENGSAYFPKGERTIKTRFSSFKAAKEFKYVDDPSKPGDIIPW